MKNSILLTGATGFLGSHLLENFLKEGYKVGVLVRSGSDLWRIEEALDDVSVFNIDEIGLADIFKSFQPTVVVHTACSYGRKGEPVSSIIETNLLFGIKVLETAIENNVQTLINTDTLLPKEVNAYSLSKAHFKEWLLFYSRSIQVINMRLEHMYGPKDDKKKFIGWLVHQMISGKKEINLTSGEQKRNFIFIDDITTAFSLALSKSKNLGSYTDLDVATDKLIEVREFVEMLADKVETQTHLPIKNRLNFGMVPYRENDVMEPFYNNDKIKNLGWRPVTDISEGLDRTIEYLL